MFKKIKHLIKSFILSTIVYIDYKTILNIAKQTFFFTFFIDKMNLQLIYVNDYIQRFNLKIRYKSNKIYIISNVFFKLTSFNTKKSFTKNKLNALFVLIKLNINNIDNINIDINNNVLFICFLMKINSIFRQKILNNYQANSK